MEIALALTSIVFIGLCGRNDGGPLLALPYQSESRGAWIPVLFLFLTVPAVSLIGSLAVAESLAGLFAPSSKGPGGSFAALAALVGVLVTLALAAVLNAPTSITLALIGALTGTSVAVGGGVDWPTLTRVIVLGLTAPLVAGLLSFLLSRMSIRALPGQTRVGGVLTWGQRISFFLLLAAYGANDGQKVLFAVALALGVTVNSAASSIGWVIGASAVFVFGAMWGVRKSSQFIRHGVARIRQPSILWTQLSAATSVFAGSILGTPLSMTQSISGALVGNGIALSRRAVYWKAIQRVGLAWVWTLPMAGTIAYLLTLFMRAVFQ